MAALAYGRAHLQRQKYFWLAVLGQHTANCQVQCQGKGFWLNPQYSSTCIPSDSQ